jgi:predicted  nucleic acid-binding Zn-ribbon protein
MNNSIRFTPTQKVVLAVALLTALSLAVVSAMLNQRLSKANDRNGELQSQLDKSKREAGKSAREISALSEKLGSRSHEVEGLQSSIDAFATQAAACEAVRARVASLGSEGRPQ